LVYTAVVNGLNNFQIGFPTEVPTGDTAVAIDSYPICATENVGVEAGLELMLTCTESGSYRYLIIQSIDTSAEKLCIAEVCVLAPGQYAVQL